MRKQWFELSSRAMSAIRRADKRHANVQRRRDDERVIRSELADNADDTE